MNNLSSAEDSEMLANNWDSDQNELIQIAADLYNDFGTNPNATAAEYMLALREAVTAHTGLFRVTIRMMARISDDVDAILKDVYQPKWMQAANFVDIMKQFTTFAFKQ